MLVENINEVKKKENETIREFNMRFQKLINKIPKDIRSK